MRPGGLELPTVAGARPAGFLSAKHVDDLHEKGRLTGQDPISRALPDISNNVGPVKLFLNTLLSFHLKECFSFVSFAFSFFCIGDHGSLVIFRSASVRPKHLFDQDFDHDY